jgi:predicted Zn-dependent protease
VSDATFDIEVRFLGGLTGSQRDAFTEAAERWEEVITGDLPDMLVGDETVDDLLILASGDKLDGPDGFVGVGKPTVGRPEGLGEASGLPAVGEMVLDTADLARLEEEGLVDTVTHEMGHVLGVGTLWAERGLVEGQGTQTPLYVGPAGEAEYGRLLGLDEPAAAPLESGGGPLTREIHWSEAVLENELMTGVLAAGPNPLSQLTAASLDDLGYAVDYEGAEAFPTAAALVADASLSLLGDDFLA